MPFTGQMHRRSTNMIYFWLSAGRNTTNEELESMLESDNPAIFTSGVSDRARVHQFDLCGPCNDCPFCCLLSDHHGQHHRAGHERDRNTAQRDHQAGKQHQRASRHVHGHGHAGGEPGEKTQGRWNDAGWHKGWSFVICSSSGFGLQSNPATFACLKVQMGWTLIFSLNWADSCKHGYKSKHVSGINHRAPCGSRPPLWCCWNDNALSNNSVVLVSAFLLTYDSINCSQCELI